MGLMGIFWVFLFGVFAEDGFEKNREEVIFRKIGYEVLQKSGAKTSKVLPIVKKPGGVFEIRFEQEVDFVTDSLVNTSRKVLNQYGLSDAYVISVRSCVKNQVIYGFSIAKNKADDVLACSGLYYPKQCVYIEISTKNNANLALVSIPILCILGLGLLYVFRKRKYIKTDMPILDLNELCLWIGTEKVTLSQKEASIMQIFLSQEGKLVDRDLIQKEVWENEGVIVGRSLDTFISKLRKKLRPYYDIKNVHGKGYRMVNF